MPRPTSMASTVATTPLARSGRRAATRRATPTAATSNPNVVHVSTRNSAIGFPASASASAPLGPNVRIGARTNTIITAWTR